MKESKFIQDPGEEILKQAFRKQRSTNTSSNNNEKVDLTKEEADRLEKAFEDKTFRNLMAEYVSEISDPKYRAEQDEYIRQLEEQNEIPHGKDILRPQPGFVIKFKYSKRRVNNNDDKKPKDSSSKGTDKLFVNIVHSKQVLQPSYSSSITADKNGKKGRNWSIPYTLGPMRMETDNKNSLVPTFDCCFHPLALVYASKNTAYRDLISVTARDGVIGQFKAGNEHVDIDNDYLVLKGTQYKNGTPPAMMIDREKASQSAVSVAPSSKPSANIMTKKDIQVDQGGKKQGKSSSNSASEHTSFAKGFLLRENKSKSKRKHNRNDLCADNKEIIRLFQGEDKVKDGNVIPHYEIIERKEFDLADHNVEGLKKPSSRPNALIVKIRLHGFSSAKDIDLDVSEDRLVLTCPRNERKYGLNIKLPYPVLSGEGTAKFDKESHTLSVTLPVIRPNVEIVYSRESREEQEKCKEQEVKVQTAPKNVVENKDGDESRIKPPLIVADPKTTLDESPVIVERPHDHSRWLNCDDQKNLREDFASDDKIPVCKIVQKEMTQEPSESEDNILLDVNSNNRATNEQNNIHNSQDDDFQVVDFADCDDTRTINDNKQASGANAFNKSDEPNISLFHCNNKFIFELD